jgi:hypothetical protein
MSDLHFPLRRILLLAFAGLAIFSLLYLAAILPDTLFRGGIFPEIPNTSGEELPQLAPLLFPPWFWNLLQVVFWVALLLSLVFSLSTPQMRRDLVNMTLSNSVNILILLLVLIIAGVITLSDEVEEVGVVPDEEPAGAIIEVELDPVADYLETLVETPEPPPSLTWLLSLLFLAGVLWLVYLLWRRRPRREERPLSFRQLSDRAFAAIAELRQGQQLDDVILRCYQEMSETVARQQHLQRGPGATPREFARTLQRAGLPETAVAQLTSLFEQVRYGGLMPGKREQLQAIDSLEAIVAACERLAQAQEKPAR